MKETIAAVVNYIKTYFPDTPILPTIGNNDVEYHNQAPGTQTKTAYYDSLWDIMFVNVAANKPIVQEADSYTTWSDGGYYVFTLPGSNLDIYTLNGMYPF
jgi:hypothetical protein